MDSEILETTWSVTLQSLDNLYPNYSKWNLTQIFNFVPILISARCIPKF